MRRCRASVRFTERAFITLGPLAEGFLRSAAAAGTPRLAGELAEIVSLEPSWGRAQLVAALERTTASAASKPRMSATSWPQARRRLTGLGRQEAATGPPRRAGPLA
jgi:hypothetical protein